MGRKRKRENVRPDTRFPMTAQIVLLELAINSANDDKKRRGGKGVNSSGTRGGHAYVRRTLNSAHAIRAGFQPRRARRASSLKPARYIPRKFAEHFQQNYPRNQYAILFPGNDVRSSNISRARLTFRGSVISKTRIRGSTCDCTVSLYCISQFGLSHTSDFQNEFHSNVM